MRPSHLLTYPLFVLAILIAGAGISADTASPDGLEASVVLPDAPTLGEASLPSGSEAGLVAEPAADPVADNAAANKPVALPIDTLNDRRADSTRLSASPCPLPTGVQGPLANPSYRYFPALYNPRVALVHPAPPALEEAEGGSPEAVQEGRDIPLLANNQILAFYGHPLSRRMGILGEYPKEELARLLKGYARLYDDANGSTGVIPAFYLIYGTCWPGGEIGYLKESLVISYIEYAASQGMEVFIDHQIGRYPVEDAVRRILPFLKYPNVHLALDPEWRTTAPMQEIGSISAEEVNKAQAMISDYLVAQGIPGVKILVVHQFRSSMITGREKVRADFERVLLVHTADGFGAPALKRNAYALNASAANMPLKGFKLFFKTTVPGAGWDDPLLTPPEVLALSPRPALIIYQ